MQAMHGFEVNLFMKRNKRRAFMNSFSILFVYEFRLKRKIQKVNK